MLEKRANGDTAIDQGSRNDVDQLRKTTRTTGVRFRYRRTNCASNFRQGLVSLLILPVIVIDSLGGLSRISVPSTRESLYKVAMAFEGR